jgi:hypothetical protein
LAYSPREWESSWLINPPRWQESPYFIGGRLLASSVQKTFVQPLQLKKNTAHPFHVTTIEVNKDNWLSKRSSLKKSLWYKMSVVVENEDTRNTINLTK